MRSDPFQDTQPYPVYPRRQFIQPSRGRRVRTGLVRGFVLFAIAAVLSLAIYLLLPLRTHILVLGTDSREAELALGRTDTIILASINPLRPNVGILSVPRDLYVEIPGVGENRINAAFFFGELEQVGGGPAAAIETFAHNFGVEPDHYMLIQFDGLKAVVDALGGVSIVLTEPMSGYQAGTHMLDGTQALAFVRDRAGSDDFFRMARGQIFLRALIAQVLKPATWPRIPSALIALAQVVETDLPIWQWPRTAVALLRAGPQGIRAEVVGRDHVTPFTTSGGAQVLSPHWPAIDLLVESVTGESPLR